MFILNLNFRLFLLLSLSFFCVLCIFFPYDLFLEYFALTEEAERKRQEKEREAQASYGRNIPQIHSKNARINDGYTRTEDQPVTIIRLKD